MLHSSVNLFRVLRQIKIKLLVSWNLNECRIEIGLRKVFYFLLIYIGLGSGRKFYGGVAVPLKKGRSQLHLSISNVATSPAQQEVPISWYSVYVCFHFDFGSCSKSVCCL